MYKTLGMANKGVGKHFQGSPLHYYSIQPKALKPNIAPELYLLTGHLLHHTAIL